MEEEKTLYDKIVEESATFEGFECFARKLLISGCALSPEARFMMYRRQRQERLKEERKKASLLKKIGYGFCKKEP